MACLLASFPATRKSAPDAGNRAQIAAARGDFAAAKTLQKESLTIYGALGDRLGIATSMEGLAGIAFLSAEPARSACLWGAAERLRQAIGAPWAPSERHRYDRAVAAARAALDDVAAFDLSWQAGRVMVLEHALAYALENNAA